MKSATLFVRCAVVLTGLSMISGCGSAPVVKVERIGSHLNVDATLSGGVDLAAIAAVVRAERAKLGSGAGLATATFDFREGEDQPVATLDYDAKQMLTISENSGDAEVLKLARESRPRPPKGELAIAQQCESAAAELQATPLCAAALEL